MSEQDWIKLSLDSNYFVAGERLTGEILVETRLNNCKIVLKSQGTEKVTIEKHGMAKNTHTNLIFSLEEVFGSSDFNDQSVYPFTFKLPPYLPATFDFHGSASDDVTIDCEVLYYIEASLHTPESKLANFSMPFTVFNRSARIVYPPTQDFDTGLTSCWCFQRGSSRISIESLDAHQTLCREHKKFKVSIASSTNENLVSAIGQVLLEIMVQFPGEKPIELRRMVTRSVPNIEILKKEAENVQNISYVFDADMSLNDVGNNPGTNRSALFSCEYRLQVLGIYDVGCRSKRAECELKLHVNPSVQKQEPIELPTGWNPKEFSLRSLLPNVNHSFVGERPE